MANCSKHNVDFWRTVHYKGIKVNVEFLTHFQTILYFLVLSPTPKPMTSVWMQFEPVICCDNRHLELDQTLNIFTVWDSASVTQFWCVSCLDSIKTSKPGFSFICFVLHMLVVFLRGWIGCLSFSVVLACSYVLSCQYEPSEWSRHILPVLRQLHWLPVRQRVHFKMAAFVHQSLSGISPSYLADDCRLVADARERRLRSTASQTCVVAWTFSCFGDRAFSAAGPGLWNSLPSGSLMYR